MLASHFNPILCVTIAVCISVVQVTGSVRTAEKILQDGGLSRVYGIYAAMGMAVVSNVILAINAMLPAPAIDLQSTASQSQVVVENGTAKVSGRIEFHVLTELKAAQNVRFVSLNSEGGSVQAGRAIGMLIAQSGWSTRVDEKCFSACTLAFAGGVKRQVIGDGMLGFHGYRFDDEMRVQTVNVAAIIEKDRAYLTAQGISKDFIDRIFQTKPNDLWRPSKEELLRSGVLR